MFDTLLHIPSTDFTILILFYYLSCAQKKNRMTMEASSFPATSFSYVNEVFARVDRGVLHLHPRLAGDNLDLNANKETKGAMAPAQRVSKI